MHEAMVEVTEQNQIRQFGQTAPRPGNYVVRL
jgi:hypothetical protein